MTRTRRGVWLQRDVYRHLITLSIITVFSSALGIIVGQYEGSGQLRPERATPVYVFVLGGTSTLYAVVYSTLTWRAFSGYRGARLRAVLRLTSHQAGSERVAMRLLLADETSVAVSAALGALAGVAFVAVSTDVRSDWMLIAGATTLLIGGWVLFVVSYAVFYLRQWAEARAVAFPEGDAGERRYSDFVYVAVALATTFGPTDMAFRSSLVRRRSTLGAIVGYLYSTVVVGLFISLALSKG